MRVDQIRQGSLFVLSDREVGNLRNATVYIRLYIPGGIRDPSKSVAQVVYSGTDRKIEGSQVSTTIVSGGTEPYPINLSDLEGILTEPEILELKKLIPINWEKRIRNFQAFCGRADEIHSSQHGYLNPHDRRDKGFIDG